MTAPTVAEQANAVARERVKLDACDRAELDIARIADGHTVECSHIARQHIANLYDAEGVCVAQFSTTSWAKTIAAVRGWAEVAS
ncbi:MAG TPA: hypothetical protein PK308_09085 [Phycisphaerales bacterium]|nr:hypothetical protein [Phycisphaerales bacterium]